MRITDTKYFSVYQSNIGKQIPSLIAEYDFSDSNGNLSYLMQASAVYSSNIEGNSIDLNSFMNHRMAKKAFKESKEVEEIENLILAYELAKNNPLTEKNFLECHKLLSKTLVPKNRQGKYRNEEIGVFGESGPVYLAIEPEFVEKTMSDFFNDISTLLKTELSVPEVFYHAALIHLKFAHIHPFVDGNGRAARLLEKWFIAEKLGQQYWKLQSERYYKSNQQAYYNNINLGVNYYELNYDKCLPFLEMLPRCLE